MVKHTGWTKDAFKRAAKKHKTKISEGANPMIPYYYRKKYGIKPARGKKRFKSARQRRAFFATEEWEREPKKPKHHSKREEEDDIYG